MKSHLQLFEDFLSEADDPTYYQETFYFTILIVMSKDRGGSRDETKNDIRALPEVLTVTLVEPEKGGVQRDVGPKYLSTLKVHVRKPKGISKDILMKRVVLLINNLRGVTVLRYKERVPKPRRKAFHGRYQITELDYQRERDKKKKQYARMKSRIIAKGPQSPGPPYNEPASTKRGQAIGDAFGAMEEDMVIRVPDTTSPSDLMAFEVRPQLQPQIWDDDQEVHPSIRTALMKIVDEFLESLDLEIDIKDITITGSLANYNWSKYSDIDVHIIVDFEEINENETMVKKFFDAVRSRWNKLHDIRVKGHEVEIYVQGDKEPHTSTGVYSLKNSRWLVIPKKIQPELDERTATKKMLFIAREIDKVSAIYDTGKYEQALDEAQRIKDKISRMRKSGLEQVGIYSPENLAFKMLRRSGDIEQLFSIYTQAYDKFFSLDQ